MHSTFSDTPVRERSNDEVTLGRIGHSTVLINFFGTWVITDPVFSARFGIPIMKTSRVVGVKRSSAPKLYIRDLPDIDIMLLSHAHLDHLHPFSCKKIIKHSHGKTTIVAAPGVAQWLSPSVKKNFHELDRGQEILLSGITIRACEVKHRGGRYPRSLDRSKGDAKGSSYNSYLMEKNKKTIFFCGDTAYTDIMKSYAPPICNLAIMPIGFYNPRIHHHCNPEQALEMAHMLHAKNVVGIHRNSRSGSIFKKDAEGEKPLQWLLASAPTYGINILWKYEGEVISI